MADLVPERSLTIAAGGVPAGAIVDAEIDGVEVVVWRGASGRLCATDARCPHQWSHFAAEGAVDGDELVCTSHFWRFAPDGSGCRLVGTDRREPVVGIGVHHVHEAADGTIIVTLHHP